MVRFFVFEDKSLRISIFEYFKRLYFELHTLFHEPFLVLEISESVCRYAERTRRAHSIDDLMNSGILITTVLPDGKDSGD